MSITVFIGYDDQLKCRNPEQLVLKKLKDAGAPVTGITQLKLETGTLTKSFRTELNGLEYTWQPAVSDSEAFEAWVSTKPVFKRYGAKLLQNPDGSYRDYRINDRWVAWQAALRFARGAE